VSITIYLVSVPTECCGSVRDRAYTTRELAEARIEDIKTLIAMADDYWEWWKERNPSGVGSSGVEEWAEGKNLDRFSGLLEDLTELDPPYIEEIEAFDCPTTSSTNQADQ